MRIIGGQARGRTLVAPAGERTRPTQDYVRESLFNILREDVPGARVLDLFAGTGALALEALSRGAAYAVLVDSDRAACACIRSNMERVRAVERCRMLFCDYRQAIRRLGEQGERFDLVFIDPPYRMENTGEICAALYESGLLLPDCLLAVEHKDTSPPRLDGRFAVVDRRSYGETRITFVRLGAKGEPKDEDAAVSGQL